MRILILAALHLAAPLSAPPLQADILVTARPVRAGTVLEPSDLLLRDGDAGSALDNPDEAIGMEATRNLYPGSPIGPDDIREPHLVTRNQEVTMHFINGSLHITTEGRAIDGGAVGQNIRVTNISSRKTVVGKVMPDGSIAVSGAMQ